MKKQNNRIIYKKPYLIRTKNLKNQRNKDFKKVNFYNKSN